MKRIVLVFYILRNVHAGGGDTAVAAWGMAARPASGGAPGGRVAAGPGGVLGPGGVAGGAAVAAVAGGALGATSARKT